MSIYEDATAYTAEPRSMRSRALSVYDDQTVLQSLHGTTSMYPSDNVQGSSRRESHFPRKPTVAHHASPPPQPQQQQHHKQQQQRSVRTVDARPMAMLAMDPAFYPSSPSSQQREQAWVQQPAFTTQQKQKTEQSPLMQASAAVALSAIIGKRVLT